VAYKELQVRRDTAANWTTNDPTLKAGEFGFETDTGKLKIGDGSTAWVSLDYIDSTIDHDSLLNVHQDVNTDADTTFAGLNITSCADLAANSAVFQPAADSTTFFQVKQADGTVFFNGDSTNGRVSIGTASTFGKFHVDGLIKFDDTNQNTLLGTDAFANDNGQYNVGLGYRAGYYNDTTGSEEKGRGNIYIGYQAGLGDSGGNTGYRNIALGANALVANTTGSYNLTFGYESLYSNTSGDENVAIGYKALNANTIGVGNVAIATSAARYNISGTGNVAIGLSCLSANQTGIRNTVIGYNAGKGQAGNSHNYNTFIGYAAGLVITTGNRNVYIGNKAGFDATSGGNNVFIGDRAGYDITTGGDNLFLGYRSGYRQTTASNLLIIDNQDRGSIANEAIQSLIYGVFNAAPASQSVTLNSDLNVRHHLVGIPDEITATSDGVAASLDTINTEVTRTGFTFNIHLEHRR